MSHGKGLCHGGDSKIGRLPWIAQVGAGEPPGPSKVERKAELGRGDMACDGATCRDGGCLQGAGTSAPQPPDDLETTVPQNLQNGAQPYPHLRLASETWSKETQ